MNLMTTVPFANRMTYNDGQINVYISTRIDVVHFLSTWQSRLLCAPYFRAIVLYRKTLDICLHVCPQTGADSLHTTFIYQSPHMHLQATEELKSHDLSSQRESAVDVHMCDHLCLQCKQLTDFFRNLKYVLYNLFSKKKCFSGLACLLCAARIYLSVYFTLDFLETCARQ